MLVEDGGRDFPKFGDLLHAAACSPAPNSNPWLHHCSSDDTTETDDEPAKHEPCVKSEGIADRSGGGTADNGVNPCISTARARALCPTHATRCRTRGCAKYSDSGSLPDGARRCQATAGCPNSAASRSLCVQHGGGRKCSRPGCSKHVASGGLCRTHGGGRRCQVADCTSSAQSRGLCYVHGGGGRCQREGCGSSAKKGGLCIAHGGGHRCQVEGCTSSAVSGARCRAHGGGRRCAVEGCASSAKTGGKCIAHGGGKRCTVAGCSSSAQRLGLCKAHGGGRRCVVEECTNSAVSRGRCIAHGGGKRCVFEGCKTTARKAGYCFAHGGRATAPTVSRAKVVSPLASAEAPLTPATVSCKPSLWPPTAEVPSIPALSLPHRRMLPSMTQMLLAQRPGIIRRAAQIPPIRSPEGSLGRARREMARTHSVAYDKWPGYCHEENTSSQACQETAFQALTPPSSRAGYSWQRLQETVRRESVDYGLTNDDEESGYDSTGLSLEENHATTSATRELYWTRSRGPVPL